MKIILSAIFLLSTIILNAQIHGNVKDINGKPLSDVHIHWSGTYDGAISDKNGHFHIDVNSQSNQLVFSYVIFENDTIAIDETNLHETIEFQFTKEKQLEEVVVTGKRADRFKMTTAVVQSEKLTRHELQKAACCNLSESFETNASVDVTYSDAATGAKQIKLLGLSGNYVQLLTENIPNMYGLSSAYGMQYIPGPWMESIQISKGVASVKTGYDAITGQINVEFKKPNTEEVFSANVFGNTKGRSEVNADGAIKLNENLYTSVFVHGSNDFINIDDNGDGYYDMPKIRQLNFANRWLYEKHGYKFQAFARALNEKRDGGTIDNAYDMGINTDRYELFVKNGFTFHNNSSLGIIVNGSFHKQDANYGVKKYLGEQSNLYANVLFDQQFGHSHSISTGVSLNANLLTEDLNTSFLILNEKKNEYVPGVFAEYTYKHGDLTAVGGVRYDHNNLYGDVFTPRMHVRYAIKDIAHIRLGAGKGFRSPNVLAESNFLLASNRRINIAENLKMEEAWNLGAGVHLFIPVFHQEVNVLLEWFYTDFVNQIVADMDSNPHEVYFDNLNGKSYANSVQIEISADLAKRLSLTLAHRINDIKTTIANELREKPLTNRFKSLATATYYTNQRVWQFDGTVQLNGGGRMPDPDVINPLWEKTYGMYPIFNAQVTRNFKDVSVYVGAENIGNYIQENPIIDAGNPFGNLFDASMVWGPLHGRTFYLGMRWNFKKHRHHD